MISESHSLAKAHVVGCNVPTSSAEFVFIQIRGTSRFILTLSQRESGSKSQHFPHFVARVMGSVSRGSEPVALRREGASERLAHSRLHESLLNQ